MGRMRGFNAPRWKDPGGKEEKQSAYRPPYKNSPPKIINPRGLGKKRAKRSGGGEREERFFLLFGSFETV